MKASRESIPLDGSSSVFGATSLGESSADYRTPITVATLDLSFEVSQFPWQQFLLPSCRSSPQRVSPTGKSISSNQVQLLSKINFIAKPGELVAIIGPSGCGKTTLLNVISGRARGKTSGEVLFNGVPIPCRELGSSVTMLHSNDKHLPYLTVRETLMFTAFLRMAHLSPSERSQLVDGVMAELSLSHVRDTQIGGSWRKGLSTGELRRTSIAQELIGNPSVILLDEPTSGLDAVLAYEVVFVLRRLAAAGRTVVCTLHQPRSLIFQLIDKVVLMAGGRILYHGGPKAAREYFSTHVGRIIDPDENTAEALLDIASDVVDANEVVSKKQFVTMRNHTLSRNAAEKFESSIQLLGLRNEILKTKQEPSRVTPSRQRNPIIQWLAEVWAVTFRSFRNTIKNPITVLSLILIQTFVGVLLGTLFFRLPEKYMPAVTPIDIGSSQSAPMELIDSDIAVFLTTGIDKRGTNPFLSMVIDGVDGNGSVPLDTFLESSAPVYLSNMLPCTHNRLELAKDPAYSEADFSPYYRYWEGAMEKSDFEGGPWTPPHIAASLLMTLQLADHTLMKSTWIEYWQFCRKAKAGRFAPLGCYACVSGAMEFLGAACECTGLPPMPTQTNECRKSADESLPWPDGVRKRRRWTRRDATIREHTERIVDVDGIADSASVPKRELQASAMIGGSLDSLSYLLPPQVTKLAQVAAEYLDAVRVCKHPACKLITSKVDGEGAAASNSLTDYGKVLGTTLQIAGALFFVTCEVGFASYDGLLAISGERAMVNREMANHLYRPSSYFIGKNLADSMFQITPTLCLTTCYFFLVGVDAGAHGHNFGIYLGACLCLMFAAYGLSYLLSALSPSMESAVVVAPMLMIVLVCCAGFFVRDSALPPIVIPLKWVSIYRWAFFALTLSQFPKGKSFGGVPNTFTLALVGVPNTTVAECCTALIALGFAFRFCAYLSLKLLHRKAGVE